MSAHGGLISSPTSEWSDFLDSLETELKWSNPVVMSCGCIVEEEDSNSSTCPSCKRQATKISSLPILQKLKSKIEAKRSSLVVRPFESLTRTFEPLTRTKSSGAPSHISVADYDSSVDNATTNIDLSLIRSDSESPLSLSPSKRLSKLSRAIAARPQQQRIGILELFRDATNELASLKYSSQMSSMIPTTITTSHRMASPGTTATNFSTGTPNVAAAFPDGFAMSPSRNLSLSPALQQIVIAQREVFFSKCFPTYRKQFEHMTQQRQLLSFARSPSFLTSISPDSSKFVLVGSSSLVVYSTPIDYNDPPQIIVKSPADPEFERLTYLSMSDTLVCTVSSFGVLRVYSFIGQSLNLIYQHNSQFPVLCMEVSPKSSLVACAVLTKGEQPMIVVHLLQTQQSVTMKSPYKDMITSLAFSADESLLACTTRHRLIAISIQQPTAPRLVMKTARRIDDSPESEGITACSFFPLTSNRMVVTSVALDSSPIVLETREDPNMAVAQASLKLRIHKVGSAIHSAAVSPREDAIAFLDKCGLVYMMQCEPGLINIRKIVVVTSVADAGSAREAASLRFSPSGQTLFIVDRKGVLHIQDFASGMPSQAGITKCRILA